MNYQYDSLQSNNQYIARDIAENKFIDPRQFMQSKDPLQIGRDPFNIGYDSNRITHREDLNEPDGQQLLKLSQKKRKEKATLINIDSRDRNIENMNILASEHFITRSGSICTTAGSFNVTINDPNHNFTNNTKITLTNLDLGSKNLNNQITIIKAPGQNVELIINHPNHGLQTLTDIEQIRLSNVGVDSSPSFGFEEIFPSPAPPAKDYYISGSTSSTTNSFIAGDNIVLFNNLGVQVTYLVIGLGTGPFAGLPIIRLQPGELSTFVTLTSVKSQFFRRVNINAINKNHIISVIDLNNYKITLDVISPEPYETISNTGGMFTASYLALNGIPSKNIVADYPTTTQRLFGNHKIRVIDANNYIIRLQKSAYKDGCLEIKDEKGNIINPNIKIGQVQRVIQGFPNPNQYLISLNRTFYNIYKIRLITSEFPNSQKVIRTGVNNKLIWQNELDGTTIYSVDIDQGNYTADSLIAEIQNKVSQVPRANQMIFNNMKVAINLETGNTTFTSLQTDTLDTNPLLMSEGTTILVIRKINHGFDNDDFVILENAPSVGGVPADKINNIQFLVKFLSVDYIQVTMSVNAKQNVGNINFDIFGNIIVGTLSGGGGGSDIIINKVLRMRMLNQDPATIGQILGFNGAGKPGYFLPDFNENVNNQNYNLLNNTNQIGNISLRGDDYFFMNSPQFGQMQNSGPVINIFSKISLVQPPGSVNFDTFGGGISVFDEPIPRIDVLEWEFKNPDNTLYDFNGANHSYLLEITELVEVAEDTSYSSRGGNKAFRDDRETQTNRTTFKRSS